MSACTSAVCDFRGPLLRSAFTMSVFVTHPVLLYEVPEMQEPMLTGLQIFFMTLDLS